MHIIYFATLASTACALATPPRSASLRARQLNNSDEVIGAPLQPDLEPHLTVRSTGSESVRRVGNMGHGLLNAITMNWKGGGLDPEEAVYEDRAFASRLQVVYKRLIPQDPIYTTAVKGWAIAQLLLQLTLDQNVKTWRVSPFYEVVDEGRRSTRIGTINIKTRNSGNGEGDLEDDTITQIAKRNGMQRDDEPGATATNITSASQIDQTILQSYLKTRLRYLEKDLATGSVIALLHAYLGAEMWAYHSFGKVSETIKAGEAIQIGPDPSRPNSPYMIVHVEATQAADQPMYYKWVVEYLLNMLEQFVKENQLKSFVSTSSWDNPSKTPQPVTILTTYCLAYGELKPSFNFNGDLRVLELPGNGTVDAVGTSVETSNSTTSSQEPPPRSPPVV